MAKDDRDPGRRINPRPVTPERDPNLHPLRDPASSLVESFGSVVDEMRQIATDLGVRPYRLFSVVIQWSGGERGRGKPTVVSETEFLPTPVVYLGSTGREATTGGGILRGEARVTELSPRYTEEDLNALFHVNPLGKNQEGFLEVVLDERMGKAIRRRFVRKGTPQYEADKFQWVCKLLAQDQPRQRDGRVRDVSVRGERL